MLDQNSVHDTIFRQLRETEEANSVRIPLAIESGSRGWGFASPDSDYDCRFVYAHRQDWYLSVFRKPDVIICADDKVFDVNGWDLRKFIVHMIASNA
ncbi:MAG: nucleotidyltransferase domain-containing protein, partial [Gracilibacteraceae bacterium]|nr:nucleotidyltransferase domain-containing protein [Gracilibacteraceae bacterium]